MIRLYFVDTYCNSVKELQAFLSKHAGEEKNCYHESVAEKYRSGLIEQWLAQELLYQKDNGNESDVSLIQSLLDALKEVRGHLHSDSEIYSWLLRVICSQSDGSPSLNPFRYIEVKKMIVFYDPNRGLIKGFLTYCVTCPSNESFGLIVAVNGVREPLTIINVNGKKDVEYTKDFDVDTKLCITGNNVSTILLFLNDVCIPPDNTYVCMDVGVEGLYYVYHCGYVYMSMRHDNIFLRHVISDVSSRVIDGLPIRTDVAYTREMEDYTWALKYNMQVEKEINEFNGLWHRYIGKYSVFERRIIVDNLERYRILCDGYVAIGAFNNQGVAIARKEGGEEVFICLDGRVIIPYFRKIWLVGEGLAAIKRSDGKVSFVSIDGDERNSEELSNMSVFSEGLLAVQRASTGEWGYMKKNGTIIGSYAIAGDFKNGRAIVFRKNWTGDKWFSIDAEFHETEIEDPQQEITPTQNPMSLDGMHIKENGEGWGLYTDDGYPVPITFNLPVIEAKILFYL